MSIITKPAFIGGNSELSDRVERLENRVSYLQEQINQLKQERK